MYMVAPNVPGLHFESMDVGHRTSQSTVRRRTEYLYMHGCSELSQYPCIHTVQV